MKLHEERTFGFIRNYQKENDGRLPYLFEIMDGEGLSQKAVEWYFKEYWIDYPNYLRLNHNEYAIMQCYANCEHYDEVAKAVGKPYGSVFVIIKRLQERGLLKPKPKKTFEEKTKTEKRKTKASEKDIVYIKIEAGEYAGLSGYALRQALNKKKSDQLIECKLYKNGKKISPYVNKSFIKVLTPWKL